MLHVCKGLCNLLELFGGVDSGGNGCSSGFHDLAHGGEVGDKALPQVVLVDPAQHIGVKQAPLLKGANFGAGSGAGFKQALGAQYLDGFADGGAADGEAGAEFFLVG